MKIKRIVVKNYRGIEELDLEVGASGAIAKGRNGSGKSSFLKAIKAALLGQDVTSDAIRHGADEAIVLVDTDDVSVRKVLHREGKPDLTVERGEIAQKKPATLLTSLLGTSSLDPMDLLLLKGKERRAAVLGALDVKVNPAMLRKWWAKCPDTWDCTGHGLDVVAGLRESFYKKRTDINRSAKAAVAEANRLNQELEAAQAAAPKEDPDLGPVEGALDEAKRARAALYARAQEAEKSRKRTAADRARVAQLLSQAGEVRANAHLVDSSEVESAKREVRTLTTHVDRLKAELGECVQRLTVAQDALACVQSRVATYERAISTADALAQQAKSLETTLDAAAVEPVTDEEADQALRAEESAKIALEAARKAHEAYQRAMLAEDAATKARDAATAAMAESLRLDELVRALTEDAPSELMAAADGIPGLSLQGDEVLLDGVSLDGLCGAEQIRFCVEVSRRANSRSKILVVDGLERLDPDAFEAFVREATRDGYQLLGTRVDRGELVIEALEPDADTATPATMPVPSSTPEVAA